MSFLRGNHLVAKGFGGGRDAQQPPLAVPLLARILALIEIVLPPAQHAVHHLSQFARRREHGHCHGAQFTEKAAAPSASDDSVAISLDLVPRPGLRAALEPHRLPRHPARARLRLRSRARRVPHRPASALRPGLGSQRPALGPRPSAPPLAGPATAASVPRHGLAGRATARRCGSRLRRDGQGRSECRARNHGNTAREPPGTVPEDGNWQSDAEPVREDGPQAT